MDMLKSYAHQVVSYLPAEQRDELFAEIYDNLCEEFDDWKTAKPELGESVFLNNCKGHPMKFATRLAADDSAYLVGPRFYLSFLSALKITASVVLLFHLVVGVLSALSGQPLWRAFLDILFSAPQSLLWFGACVLGVFVALEKSGEQATWLDKWDASELETLDDHQSIPLGETVFELIVASFALLWVLDILRLPSVISQDGGWVSEWTVNLPDTFWWGIGVLLVVDIVSGIYRLSRSIWSRRMRLLTLVTRALWIVLVVYAALQPDLLSVSDPGAGDLLLLAEKTLKSGLYVFCLITAWEIFKHIRRLVRSPV